MITKFKDFVYESIDNSRNKMKNVVDNLLKKEKGGSNYFDKIDSTLKLPKNLDMIKDTFEYINKNNKDFNLILTGGFGDWILSLIKKGILYVPNNVVLVNGSIRGKNNKLNKITQGKEVSIFFKRYNIDNQEFIMFDDSYYSGSTKKSIERFLKKFNSSITQTYVLYDGNDHIDKNRSSLYKYYNYHIGSKLSPQKLLNYLYDLELDIPIHNIENKITKGDIITLRQLNIEINNILSKFNMDKIDIKNYNRKTEMELKEKINL